MIFLKKNGYLKASSAKVASKRLVSRMFPAMRYQIGGLAECFATYHAFVRFFSCNSRDDWSEKLLVFECPKVNYRVLLLRAARFDQHSKAERKTIPS